MPSLLFNTLFLLVFISPSCFAQTVRQAFVPEEGRLLIIAEATPAGLISVRGKKDWFKHYFNFIHEQDVKVVSYINSHWNAYPLFQPLKWGDARVEQDPEIKALWLKETKGYLQSSPELFDKLSGTP